MSQPTPPPPPPALLNHPCPPPPPIPSEPQCLLLAVREMGRGQPFRLHTGTNNTIRVRWGLWGEQFCVCRNFRCFFLHLW